MNIHQPFDTAIPDVQLLHLYTKVEEDGILVGLDAETITTCCENPEIYGRLRAAVHEEFKPRTVYQNVLADRIAQTLWRIERYAAFENTAISHQIEKDWDRVGKLCQRPNAAFRAWHAWLVLDGPQRKSLQEALKLEDRAWRRHRALSAELRLVQRMSMH